jgi:hypothetical protein
MDAEKLLKSAISSSKQTSGKLWLLPPIFFTPILLFCGFIFDVTEQPANWAAVGYHVQSSNSSNTSCWNDVFDLERVSFAARTILIDVVYSTNFVNYTNQFSSICDRMNKCANPLVNLHSSYFFLEHVSHLIRLFVVMHACM